MGAALIYMNRANMQPIVVPITQSSGKAKPSPNIHSTVVNIPLTDERYMRAPQPLRNWLYEPEIPTLGAIASIPIGIHTRGLPERYQSVGMITIGDETKREVLPLYGRRTGSGGDRWNYYTRTDTYNPVQIPIRHKNRECTKDVGCTELFDDENVRIDALNKNGTVHIYPNDGPRYVGSLI